LLFDRNAVAPLTTGFSASLYRENLWSVTTLSQLQTSRAAHAAKLGGRRGRGLASVEARARPQALPPDGSFSPGRATEPTKRGAGGGHPLHQLRIRRTRIAVALAHEQGRLARFGRSIPDVDSVSHAKLSTVIRRNKVRRPLVAWAARLRPRPKLPGIRVTVVICISAPIPDLVRGSRFQALAEFLADPARRWSRHFAIDSAAASAFLHAWDRVMRRRCLPPTPPVNVGWHISVAPGVRAGRMIVGNS